MSRKILFLIGTALPLVISACAVGPDYKAPEITAVDGWHSEPLRPTSLDKIDQTWWKNFRDPLLNNLIVEAAEHNHDIQKALAVIEEARALRTASRSGFFPSITATESAERQGLSKTTSPHERERDQFSAGLDASWELDLFGKHRRASQAGSARFDAAVEEKRGMMLSVLAETASTYFTVRGLQKHIAVTQRNIALLKEVEDLANSRFQSGVVTEFDVARARGEREAMEAQLPGLEAELAATIHRLSVLSGQPPEYHRTTLAQHAPLPDAPDLVPVGLRSDILRRRPDVRQAERELAAATADIGVATANLFPSFSLTGDITSTARTFGDLFTGNTVSYAVGQALKWPVFAGGSLKAQVNATNARQKIALAGYEQTVLKALEDAENALIRYGKEWETLKRLKAVEASRKEAFDIAKIRYEAGEENFLVILDAERSLISAQDEVITSETRILTRLTQLYKSLGGGWKNFEEEKDTTPAAPASDNIQPDPQ
ncbi:MAG: outer membrane protein multidrug efflux system [Rickettsiales bacterium]|nr:outer membrane protein multidrug efflux system [Rickettsiales bacterium]